MKKATYGIFASALLALAACTTETLPGTTAKPAEREEQTAVAGELMVKFDPRVSEIIERAALAAHNGAPATRSGVPGVDEILDLVGGYEIERVFPVDERTEERTRKAGLHQWYVVRFGGEQSPEEVAEHLSQLGEVQKVSLNRTIKRAYNAEKRAIPLTPAALEAIARKATRAADDYPYDDPLLPKQWHLINRGDMFRPEGGEIKSVAGADVQCEEAWKLSEGDPSIVVAVLDEGICLTHPDLRANLWVNEDEIERSHEDNDGNGYAGDYHGYNFVAGSGIISWDNISDSGHATHVAGVIAAQNGNGEGIASIAGGTASKPGVKLMSCQIFSGNMVSSAMATIRAIKYAADNGAVILQCSWGYVSGLANGYDWSPTFATEEEWEAGAPLEKEALDYFIHNAGSPNGPIDGGIAIFAGGNESAPMAGFPGAAEMCVSVAGTAADFTPAVYTNYGPGTTISAPGGDQDYYFEYAGAEGTYVGLEEADGERGMVGCVLSTLPYTVSETGYGYMEGTSMACPHVSGVAALALSYAAQLRRHFTADEFKRLLHENVTPIDDCMTGRKTYYRYVTDLELSHPRQMLLSEFRGKMGSGQVNAAKLLNAIAGNGTQMTFPHLYVPLGGDVTAIPANYFLGGEGLTYTVTIADTTVATATMDGAKLTVRGLRAGTTAASVAASNGEKQEFNIVVRAGADGNGWL
ncbi:MAG: S8 family serine peptidase [Alistipes sp.]|nr:S8 family serine peptidase [Alistipes senegalensis]MCM1249876.1 S8 family serine peptidase [Alistipes sp.]